MTPADRLQLLCVKLRETGLAEWLAGKAACLIFKLPKGVDRTINNFQLNRNVKREREVVKVGKYLPPSPCLIHWTQSCVTLTEEKPTELCLCII